MDHFIGGLFFNMAMVCDLLLTHYKHTYFTAKRGTQLIGILLLCFVMILFVLSVIVTFFL